MGKVQTKVGQSDLRLSILHYQYIRNNCDAFEHVGLVRDGETFDIELAGRIEQIKIDQITPSMWSVVNIKPVWGTFFYDEDSPDFSDNIIVLNEKLWSKIKSESAQTDGYQVRVNAKTYKVVGVAPDSFFIGYSRADAWIPRESNLQIFIRTKETIWIAWHSLGWEKVKLHWMPPTNSITHMRSL